MKKKPNLVMAQIKRLKKKLTLTVSKHDWDFSHHEVIRISQQLDEFIVRAMQEKKHQHNKFYRYSSAARDNYFPLEGGEDC